MNTGTPKNRPALVSAACLAVGILGAFGALNSYQGARGYNAQYPDAYGARVAQIRFAPLLPRVPASAQLGYITDLDPSQTAYSAAFLAAQYAVSPRLLFIVNAANRPEWAVGNFSKPQDFAAAGRAKGYALAGDFGNGVILFHRMNP